MHLDKSSKTHQRCFTFFLSCISAPFSKYMNVRNIQTWLKILNQLYIYSIVVFYLFMVSVWFLQQGKRVVIRSLEKASDVYSSYEFWGLNLGHQAWRQALSAEPFYMSPTLLTLNVRFLSLRFLPLPP